MVVWLAPVCGAVACALAAAVCARRYGAGGIGWVSARFGELPAERAAERRARELLRSCLGDAEWAMYRDLGFIRVQGQAPRSGASTQSKRNASYAYLVYPHKPIVSYLPRSGRLLSEYTVDVGTSASAESDRLSASDDVLVKWMGLTADDRRLLQRALVRPPGFRHDCRKLRRDLWRLAVWERETGSGFDVIESPPR